MPTMLDQPARSDPGEKDPEAQLLEQLRRSRNPRDREAALQVLARQAAAREHEADHTESRATRQSNTEIAQGQKQTAADALNESRRARLEEAKAGQQDRRNTGLLAGAQSPEFSAIYGKKGP